MWSSVSSFYLPVRQDLTAVGRIALGSNLGASDNAGYKLYVPDKEAEKCKTNFLPSFI